MSGTMRANGVMARLILDGGGTTRREGIMKTGWSRSEPTVHMNSSGVMNTGWPAGQFVLADPAWALGGDRHGRPLRVMSSASRRVVATDGKRRPAANAGLSIRLARRGDERGGPAPQQTTPMARAYVIDDMVARNDAGPPSPSPELTTALSTIREFAGIVYDEAVAEGVSPELVFVQSRRDRLAAVRRRRRGDQFNCRHALLAAAGSRFPDVRHPSPGSALCAPTRDPSASADSLAYPHRGSALLLRA